MRFARSRKLRRPHRLRKPTGRGPLTITSCLSRATRTLNMMRTSAPSCLAGAFRALSISSSVTRPTILPALSQQLQSSHSVRCFSASSAMNSWLEPRMDRNKKMMKGRVRVATGGSIKGTTVVWGQYGLRMTDHGRRISAAQLKVAEDTIKARLRGQKYRIYKRVNCNIGVFVSGNEIRMGKGKGSFDHWAARVAVNQICFELKGLIHEKVVRDAFRLAGNKLPGQWEFVHKGEPPVVGVTKLKNGLTLEELKRPRRKIEGTTISPSSSSESPRAPLDNP